jgi:hypothetical protein
MILSEMKSAEQLPGERSPAQDEVDVPDVLDDGGDQPAC